MDLLPYVSGEAFCGLCMQTAYEVALLSNTHVDFFAAVQVYPAPAWLCRWCEGRLRGFESLRKKARRAHYLFTLLNNFGQGSLDFLENREGVESEIELLKSNNMVAKVLEVSEWTTPAPEYVDVKVDGGSLDTRRRRRKKREPATPVKVELSSVVDDDDSWDAVPLNRLKDEEVHVSPTALVGATASDFSNLDMVVDDLEGAEKKPVFSGQDEDKTRISQPSNEDEMEGVDSKVLDINKAIDDLDNESYIVSEEVHRHVETITLSEAGDKQRAFRAKKLSYVFAAHRCTACVLGFATRLEYDVHMHNHSAEAGPHRCHPCGMHFAKHRELERHLQSHYRRFRCRVCSHGSPDYRAAVKHYVSQHSRVRFTCMHCNKDFRRPINLKKHIEKLHKIEQETGCAVCGDAFPDAERLRAHMQCHKPEEISWHECPLCKKKSRNKYNMMQHIKAHDKEQLPIVCDVCHKTFKTVLLLTTHVQRLHTPNSKKFQCDECGKFFYDKGELRIHVQWTHKREGGVDCPQCARKFRTAYLLKDHVRRLHDNIPKPKDKLCDFCGRGFSSRKTLKSHRYIHTGERPHACPDCGQAFRQRCAMRLHYKSKHLHMRWRDLVSKGKRKG